MSIWLNYTHEQVAWGMILPSYVYLVDKLYPLAWAKLFSGDEFETNLFLSYVDQQALLHMLENKDNDRYFDTQGIRDILLHAYPYEIQMKCLWETIHNNTQRNQKLIWLFNTFFGIDYTQVIADYTHQRDMSVYARAKNLETRTYTNRVSCVFAYLWFIDSLLRSQWFHKEADRHNDFADKHLRVTYTQWISGVTTQVGEQIIIEVGNDTYITLFHELVHFTNRFFRFHYYQETDVCFDNYTRTNEGLANFVAYHLLDSISTQDITNIDKMTTDPLFFSIYIDIYARLIQEWTNYRAHNFSLINSALHDFYGNLLTQRKADFYYQRFYKFFHYDQHKYFYPKELMYHIGYHEIREMFCVSDNKTQLLAQCLLGKVCL